VEADDYTASFGFQWNKFSRVQLDSHNHSGFSEERFRSITGWGEPELHGKRVLDAGCGAGRFAEVALKYGSDLAAIDLSTAVEACRANLSPYDPLVCQASIYDLPFKPGSFDFVYCIGVIQHTPDPLKSIHCLCEMVKPGGQIGLWIYETTLKAFVGTTGFKYALRPIISRWTREKQETFCRRLVKVFYPLIGILKNWGLFGKIIMRLLPVSSAHLQSVRLSPSDFETWVVLDTFDMYTPAYDQPQRYSTVARVLAQQGFDNIQRHPHGAISMTATRRS
jgi:2-polyprenyl-3-methyl-5-hydroxy-6-metoxy-1,4-benzoquinol methylase